MSSDVASGVHVIFGSGPVGMAVMDELLARGRQVRLVKRSGTATVPAGVEVVTGDATDPESTRAVCKGAAVVYNCTNAPDYQKWPEQWPPLLAGPLEGAAANGARLVMMDNLYMYGPHGGVPMTEELPHNGQGSRSSTRVQMARDLQAAHESGRVRVVSGRAADFFGPRVKQSLMGAPVFQAALAGKAAQMLLNIDQPHTYSYMPDVGKALVILGEEDAALGQAWHLPAPETVTTRHFLGIVYEEAAQPFKVMVLPKWAVRIVSLFVPALNGIAENFYQLDEPYQMDHSKFDRAFGHLLQPTPLREAIRTTLEWNRHNRPA